MHSFRTQVAAAAARLALALSATAVLTTAVLADTRIFIVENSDGYGIDRCLAAGAPCGERVAAAWCHSHDYERAIDFGRVADTAPTPAGPAGDGACTGPLCPEAVAITCSR